mmetsp:Transcript_10254/g.16546  ORF Transcript_10254/g.16546 Transcript_10254/m.16546 type:complete len:349 (-) Transcript_10254:217-1263(-)
MYPAIKQRSHANCHGGMVMGAIIFLLPIMAKKHRASRIRGQAAAQSHCLLLGHLPPFAPRSASLRLSTGSSRRALASVIFQGSLHAGGRPRSDAAVALAAHHRAGAAVVPPATIGTGTRAQFAPLLQPPPPGRLGQEHGAAPGVGQRLGGQVHAQHPPARGHHLRHVGGGGRVHRADDEPAEGPVVRRDREGLQPDPVVGRGAPGEAGGGLVGDRGVDQVVVLVDQGAAAGLQFAGEHDGSCREPKIGKGQNHANHSQTDREDSQMLFLPNICHIAIQVVDNLIRVDVAVMVPIHFFQAFCKVSEFCPSRDVVNCYERRPFVLSCISRPLTALFFRILRHLLCGCGLS